MKDDDTWHSGPPPSVGWWPASAFEDKDCLRWWNGAAWSVGCFDGYSPSELDRLAMQISYQADVKWQHRPASWPKRSRT